MDEFRVLIVEDEEEWQNILNPVVSALSTLEPDRTGTEQKAKKLIENNSYDLVILDLGLEDSSPDQTPDETLKLINFLKNQPHNRNCAAVVLTISATSEYTKKALVEYHAEDFIPKNNFDDDATVSLLRRSICKARLNLAEEKKDRRCQVSVTFEKNSIHSIELRGPIRDITTRNQSLQLDFADIATRADNLNILLRNELWQQWRQEAKWIGEQIEEILVTEPKILQYLNVAKTESNGDKVWIEFCGSSEALCIPFELLRSADRFLALSYVMTRKHIQPNSIPSKKVNPFHKFVSDLIGKNKKLRILIVGSNADETIPEAEFEAEVLAEEIETALENLNIDSHIDLLTGESATYSRVKEELNKRNHHIFHYSGHGRFNDELPEISGIVLRDKIHHRTMTAAELNLLVENSDLQLIYLSCCLGARTASQIDDGDFFGMFDSLAKADIPAVLGYKWIVDDISALKLAGVFYQQLWKTFCLGESLLFARQEMKAGNPSGNDKTWASPILLLQNP